MSHALPLKPPPALPPRSDPFRYGWRYVLRGTDRDGNEVWDQVPLTLDDVLHPEVGDFIVNSSAHARDCIYLAYVLRARRKRWRRRTVVLMDTRVAWDVIALRAHGPDIAVIHGVRRPDRNFRTFDVAAEKVRPNLIIEVTSKDTRFNDLVTKVTQYHQAGVRQYVIVDANEPDDGPRTLRLVAYRHGSQRYEPMPLDDQGRVELLGLGLLLGTCGERIALYDAETGEEVGEYDAVTEVLEARTAALEAEIAARAEAEKAIEEAVEARREAERGRKAEEEARRAAEARAADLAARLRELEERLKPTPRQGSQ
jgi:Uma2 family endonuclease